MRRFSQSEFKTFACARRWWLSDYRRLSPVTLNPSGPLRSGSRVHTALEVFYGPEPGRYLEALAQEQMNDWASYEDNCVELGVFPDGEVHKAYLKDCELERAMLEGYADWVAESGVDAGIEFTAIEEIVSVRGSDFAPEIVERFGEFEVVGKLDARILRLMDGARKFVDHKPQPLWSPVLTPNGWSTIGDLKIGDAVSAPDGSEVHVTAVYDRGSEDVYAVTLNDGTVVHGTEDHPWWAKVHINGKYKIMETKDLKLNRSRIAGFEPRHDTADRELPLPPYMLGAWIANGSRSGRNITDGIPETIAATGLPVHEINTKGRNTQYEVRLRVPHRSALDDLNLLGLYSPERFIPDSYMHGTSYNQRMDLLHGLMDGDGCLTTHSHSSVYTTTSKLLAEDVAQLVRSLGGWAKVWCSGKPNRVGTNADGYDTENTAYSVSVRSTFNPFKHVQHAERWTARKEKVRGHKGTKSTDKIVKKVEKVSNEPVRCIQIDSEDHLYVTTGYAISHNTAASLTSALATLHMNPQMLHYAWLERMTQPEGTWSDGALYNVLKKVKRGKQAKPPFYDRFEVNHNDDQIASYELHMKRKITKIFELEALLKDATVEEQAHIAEPSPDDSCSWKCQFFTLCPMYDDGSRAEDMVREEFAERDPLARYVEVIKDA